MVASSAPLFERLTDLPQVKSILSFFHADLAVQVLVHSLEGITRLWDGKDDKARKV